MAKNIDNTKCIHCLEIPDEITDDHIIPSSWYSTDYSKDVFKPTAPSCHKCNNELGKKEKILSHIMWMCMPETHPLRKELAVKTYRAFGITSDGNPLPGLNEKERRIRLLYLKQLMSMTVPSGNLNKTRIIPGFGYHPGYPKSIQRIVKMDEQVMQDVASKVVRGLEYIQKKQNRYIEEPYKLYIYFPPNPQDSALQKAREVSPIFSDGTNTIQRLASPNAPLEPIYIIRLWNLWEVWGVIIHKEKEIELIQS